MTPLRTKPTQLPSYRELCALLEHEAPLFVPIEKVSTHYPNYTTILNLLQSYNLSTDFFTNEMPFGALENLDVFTGVMQMFEGLVDNILRTQDDPKQKELFDALYDYLSEEDPLQKVDLLFVFGSKAKFRTEKAIELYKKGFAPRIVLSGRCPFYELSKNEKPESEILAEFAITQGVPPEALILEKESISIPDNAKRSLALFGKEHIPHSRIILVNSPFAQRRGWCHFNKLTLPGSTLLRANVGTVSPQFSKEGWYHSEEGAQTITKEFWGLRVSTFINSA